MSGLLRIISDGTAHGTVVMTERGEVVRNITSVKFAPIVPGGLVTVSLDVHAEVHVLARDNGFAKKQEEKRLQDRADGIKAWLMERGGASVALVKRHFGLVDSELPALQDCIQRGGFLCRGWAGKGRWMPSLGLPCIFAKAGRHHQHAAEECRHG